MVQYRQNISYALNQPLNIQPPQPVIAKRAPTVNDIGYALGTLWIYQAGNSAYILTKIAGNLATWDLLNNSGGSGSFSTLTSTGNTTLGTASGSVNTFGSLAGASGTTISVGTGNLVVQGAAGSTMAFGTGVTTGSITVGAALTTGALALGSSTGLTTVTPNTQTIASPATTGTLNANVGVITCTGFTTANAGGTQTFTITNNKVKTTSFVGLTVASLNASTNGALLSVKGLVLSANTMAITVANNGAGALGAGDNILLSFTVNS